MSKGPDAFRTISEVAEELDLPQHVLRFWETRFSQIKPMKRGGGRRYYRPDDVELLRGIRRLLYGEGYTIKGVQRILKEQGLRHVAAFGQDGGLDPAPESGIEDEDEPGFDPRPEPEPPTERRVGRAPAEERREPAFERHEPIAPPRARENAERPLTAERPLSAERHVADERHVAAERPVPPQRREPVAGPVPSVSNFPAAPPDEPDSFESFLPPLVTASPEPPERSSAGQREEDPYRPPRTDERRDPRMQPQPPPAPSRPAPGAPRLAADDLQLLQSALAQLIDCKRLLDQAR